MAGSPDHVRANMCESVVVPHEGKCEVDPQSQITHSDGDESDTLPGLVQREDEDSETEEATRITTLESGDPHASAHSANYHGKDLSTKVTCPSPKSKGKGESTKEPKATKAREPQSVT